MSTAASHIVTHGPKHTLVPLLGGCRSRLLDLLPCLIDGIPEAVSRAAPEGRKLVKLT